jgi:tRNA(adenine34) deaminase
MKGSCAQRIASPQRMVRTRLFLHRLDYSAWEDPGGVPQRHDAVAHAEIEVIHAAGASFENGELREATLYTALQPCGMCTTAAIWLKVGRNVFGAGREDVHKMYFEARHVDTAGFRCQGLQGRSVEGGILRDECAVLYYRIWDDVPRDDQGNFSG